jgi:hypothetical protein
MADHVFISHANEDHDFVLPLAEALKARGVPVWIDNWDIPPGANWELTVEDALYACARFLIVLSPAAVRSPEVRGELRTALNENKPILPLLYQECRIPYRLHAIQYVDFRNLGPDDEAALAEVLRALGAREADVRAQKNEKRSLRVDLNRQRVWLGSYDITAGISAQDYQMLACLYRYRDRACSKDLLASEAWPVSITDGVTDQAIAASIARLRRTLRKYAGADQDYIETIRGFGYRLHSEGFER